MGFKREGELGVFKSSVRKGKLEAREKRKGKLSDNTV